MRHALRSLFVVGLLCWALPLLADEKPAKLAATPEEVFQRFVKLAADDKLDAMLDLLTKEHRELVREEIAQEVKFTADEAKAIKTLNEVLDKKLPQRAGQTLKAKATGGDEEVARYQLKHFYRYTEIVRRERKSEDEVHLKIRLVNEVEPKRGLIATVAVVREGGEWRIRLPFSAEDKRETARKLKEAFEEYLKGIEKLSQAVGDEGHTLRVIVLSKLGMLSGRLITVRSDAATFDIEKWKKHYEPYDFSKNP